MIEILWLSKHPKILNKYSGQWIAIWQNKVIGSNSSLSQLANRLPKLQQKKQPVFFKVPRKDEGPYVLILK